MSVSTDTSTVGTSSLYSASAASNAASSKASYGKPHPFCAGMYTRLPPAFATGVGTALMRAPRPPVAFTWYSLP